MKNAWKIEIDSCLLNSNIRSYNIDKLLENRGDTSKSYIIDKQIYMFEKDFTLIQLIENKYLLYNEMDNINIEVVYNNVNKHLSSIFLYTEEYFLSIKDEYMNFYLSLKFILDKYVSSGNSDYIEKLYPVSISLGTNVTGGKLYYFYKDSKHNIIK